MERIFTLKDQLEFADLSGDRNPLHIDDLEARRTMFGAPVVHGLHMVLWAIDCWIQKQNVKIRLTSIKVVFQKPVRIETRVHYGIDEEKDSQVVISLKDQDGIVARISLIWLCAESLNTQIFNSSIPPQGPCRSLSDQVIADMRGRIPLYLNEGMLLKLFPSAGRWLDPLQMAELLATTRMVGMECPGLQSVFSKLELSFSSAEQTAESNFAYWVQRLDLRFRLVSIDVEGPDVKGRVTAFLRPPQKDQQSSLAIKDRVKKDEFAGQCALVVGGSRGLGEVTAKLLAQGGASVFVTYYRGKEDADRVVKEISDCGGKAEARFLNVLDSDIDTANLLGDQKPTHLYFFATPFIFSATRGVFSRELFDKFSSYYVSGFSNLVNKLDSLGIKRIFYPSSVAVDELPMNMGEYACSKMAGEMLCRYMAKCDPRKTVYLSRLPRMDTDQTASILPADNKDPVPLMLNILRAFRDGVPQGNDSIFTA